MQPPQQGFDTDDAPGGQLDLGLVVEQELVAIDGEAQIVLEVHPRPYSGVEIGTEEAKGVTSLLLREVERRIGVLDEALHVDRVPWTNR